MIKIVTVVGARPQFIKAAVLSRKIQTRDDIQEILVHTGQHFDANMSDIFFEEMNIPHPDYSLEIHSLTHGAMTGRMMEHIESILCKETPHLVLIYGDTNSTLAGALAAAKLHIPVAHVEAGLRSFNMKMPEEINRIVADRLSSLLFCPTQTAIENLKREGFENFPCKIYHTGDIMQDAAIYYARQAEANSTILEKHNLVPGEYVLATIHRAENTDNVLRLQSIIEALNETHKRLPVIVPLHPRTQKILVQTGLSPHFNIISPVGYFDMIQLIKNSRMVMTDSGGVQKEAYFFRRPCITLRDETEWTELVEHGFNRLVGTNTHAILQAVEDWLLHVPDFSIELYGGGKAADKILASICQFMHEKNIV